MLFKNTAGQGVYLFATDSAGVPKTGDSANITAVISKDGGTDAATATAHPTEVGSGRYWLPLSQAETNAGALSLSGASTTSGVVVEPIIVYTAGGTKLPATVATGDAADATTLLARLTTTRAGNLDFLDMAVSTIPAGVWTATGRTLSSFGFTVTASPVTLAASQTLYAPAKASDLPTDYQQRSVPVTLPTTAPSGYGGGGSIGSTAPAGWINAAAFATDALSAGAVSAAAVTKIQAGASGGGGSTDLTPVLNRLGTPAGASIAADIAAIAQANADLLTYGTVNDTTPTVNSFRGSSDLSADAGSYVGEYLKFTSGANRNQKPRAVTDYNPTSKLISFGTPWPFTPATSDKFLITGAAS